MDLAELPEASGVALGRRLPRRLWMHNDSGEPVVLGFDADGILRDRVRVRGADVEDWEDIATGPCPAGTCLYIADIGDNDQDRPHVTLYRVPEPQPGDTETRAAEVFHATYPDGPHDAEAVLVTPKGDVLLATKEPPASLYRFPGPLRPGSRAMLEHVMPLTDDHETSGKGRRRAARITGGSVSMDGEWVALRSNTEVRFFRTRDLNLGEGGAAIRVDLRGLNEPQGEAVSFGEGAVVYLVGEGGKKGRPGTLARMTCSLPR